VRQPATGLKGLEGGEGGLKELIGLLACGKTASNAHRCPAEIEIEVAQGGRDRWPFRSSDCLLMTVLGGHESIGDEANEYVDA
jgi:hypothetical protein